MKKEKRFIVDKTDLAILRLMQERGRISNVELAQELQMAPSAMLERVKKLEQNHAILEYSARINPLVLQQKMLAFVFLKVVEGAKWDYAATELLKIPEVQEIHNLAGDDCYVLKIRTYDSASLVDIMRNQINKIAGITTTRTSIVLETLKEHSHLVVPDEIE